MPYASAEDLINRYGKDELVAILPGEGPETYNESLVSIALADSSNEIDTYLAERYHLPMEPIPDILKAAACDIARYRYYTHQATEEVKQRYDDRIAWLKLVAVGKAGIGQQEQQQQSALSQTYHKKGYRDRTFTRDSFNGY